MSETTRTFSDGSTIESSDSGLQAVSGEIAMTLYKLTVAKRMLEMEINTGMRMSRGMTALQGARNVLGIEFKNRKQALVAITQALEGLKKSEG